MVMPGEDVGPAPKRSKLAKRTPKSQPGVQLAEMEVREAEASKARLGILTGTPAVNPPVQPTQPQPEVQPIYNQLVDAEDLSEPEHDAQPAPINPTDYFRSVTYQERTRREEADWKAVFPKMFLAYMPCSRTTYQWTDPVLWNYDMNESCNCATWQKKEVSIDAIDWCSRSKITLQVCDCTPRAVRLLRKGYIAGSPKAAKVAFTVRLLRYHHILWKHCGVRLAPFVETQDEFLDPRNPLLLNPGTNQSLDWRRSFSAAVDAFREMLSLQEQMTTQALRLSPEDILASTCPPCFGPEVPGKRPSEPNAVVCLDGNFQHRRHQAASAMWRGESGVVPTLFLSPEEVKHWEIQMAKPQADAAKVIHPCSAQHTAADDVRGGHSFRSYDETGLMGMGCRHDHILKFINIIKSGEKGHFAVAMLGWLLKQSEHDRKYAVLYDIGCNMEKGIIKVTFLF
ncbi:hypothetical protein DFH28DRAFT_1086914 [Melampsora americana]|nr:hypothetical protein DFH28DRAFT_1086914 [Melampsora americana]